MRYARPYGLDMTPIYCTTHYKGTCSCLATLDVTPPPAKGTQAQRGRVFWEGGENVKKSKKKLKKSFDIKNDIIYTIFETKRLVFEFFLWVVRLQGGLSLFVAGFVVVFFLFYFFLASPTSWLSSLLSLLS